MAATRTNHRQPAKLRQHEATGQNTTALFAVERYCLRQILTYLFLSEMGALEIKDSLFGEWRGQESRAPFIRGSIAWCCVDSTA
jgi:hypothetical protein